MKGPIRDPGPRETTGCKLADPGPALTPSTLSVSQRPNQNAPVLIQANPSCSLAPSTRGRRETTKWPSRAHQKRNSSLPASLRSASNGTLSAVQSGEVSAISSGPSAGRRRHGGAGSQRAFGRSAAVTWRITWQHTPPSLVFCTLSTRFAFAVRVSAGSRADADSTENHPSTVLRSPLSALRSPPNSRTKLGNESIFEQHRTNSRYESIIAPDLESGWPWMMGGRTRSRDTLISEMRASTA